MREYAMLYDSATVKYFVIAKDPLDKMWHTISPGLSEEQAEAMVYGYRAQQEG